MKKLNINTIKILTIGCTLSILLGFFTACKQIDIEKNVKHDTAIVEGCLIEKKDNVILNYITIINYNNDEYRFKDEKIYNKCKDKINQEIDINVYTIKMPLFLSFLDDEYVINIL